MSRPRAALIVSSLAGAAAAVVLLIVTLQSGESERFKSTGDRLPPTPSGLVIPTGPLQFYLATIVPPQGDAVQPTEISIEGERFPYDPAALYQRIQGTEPGWQWRITYDDDTGSGPGSNLILDWTGKVTKQDILPRHATIFQPLLDYVGVPIEVRADVPAPTATPAPTPIIITIAGKKVTLPPGMNYFHSSNGGVHSKMTTQTVALSEPGALSSVELDDVGRITYARVLPQHMTLFQPILDTALPQLPTKITIYGQEITLAPGMSYTEWTALGTDDRLWSVQYISIPAKPKMSYINIEMLTGIVYRSHLNPGDEPLFQPVLDLAASWRQQQN